jgi:WD40 repeat protein
VTPADTPPRYHAFISYSHSDSAWSAWLHRSLETYRVPRRLAGRPSRDGVVPSRIYPVFRDREELPGSADLAANITEALAASRYLVVICSPRSAVSRWVNEEIRAFKATHGEGRVLCLVVDGEPNATDKPGSGLLECFPEAVRHRVARDGTVLADRAEPIAADARPEGDGRGNAKLKLIAGLTGVPYDALRQRERRRRIARRLKLTGAAVAVCAALLGVWRSGAGTAAESRRAEHRQRAELLLQKTRDALALRREAAAALYAAHTLHESLLAGDAPAEPDLLSSLSPPALLQRTLEGARMHRSLAFAPDSAHVAVGTGDGIVRIFRTATGAAVTALATGATTPVTSVAWSAAGARLAAGTVDGRVLVWHAPPDGPASAWSVPDARAVHTGAVLGLAWSPDSAKLASGGEDGRIVLRDAASLAVSADVAAHTAEVNAVAWSGDGAWLASGGQDNALRLWTPDGRAAATLATYRQPVMAVAFDPRTEILGVAVRDGSTKLWDLRARREQAALGADRLAVLDVAFSPDGELAAAAGRNRTVSLWEVATGDLLTTLVGHGDEVWSVAWSADGRTLASGSRDGEVKLWRIAPRQVNGTLAGHTGPVRGIDVSPDGRIVASCADDGEIRLWDLAERRHIATLQGHESSVRSVAWSPDGVWLASAGTDKTVRLWDVASRREAARAVAHAKWAVDVAWSRDGRLLASAGWDHTVGLHSVPDLARVATLTGHTAEVSGVAFAPDGTLATASYDGMVKLFRTAPDARAAALVATLPGHVRHVRTVAFSRDGSLLVSGGFDRRARLWDPIRRVETRSFLGHHSEEIWMLRVSPDGRLVACATPSQDRHTLRLADASNGHIVARLSGHDEYALAIAFTPDGRWLVSGGTDAVLRLWRIADFWPPRDTGASDDPGALVRDFLARPPLRAEGAAALAERIAALTGLVLAGTEVVAASNAERR